MEVRQIRDLFELNYCEIRPSCVDFPDRSLLQVRCIDPASEGVQIQTSVSMISWRLMCFPSEGSTGGVGRRLQAGKSVALRKTKIIDRNGYGLPSQLV